MDLREAERNLQLIRSMMERATTWTGLPAYACFGAAACGFAGWGASALQGLAFTSAASAPGLLLTWILVASVAAIQIVAFTVMAAKRRGEPAMSRLTWSILFATLPGLFTGGVLTAVVSPELRPVLWMLCYGTALLGLGVFAGWKANIAGILFLAAGVAGLVGWPDRTLDLLGLSFGGIHALLGALLWIKPRGPHELDAAPEA